MNEAIFVLQVAVMVGMVKGAERLGKEAIMTLAVLLALFANFFVLKQIELAGWTVTCSDAYVVGHLMCLNLLQQYVSPESARKTVVLSFGAMLLFALLSQIHLLFTPSDVDSVDGHYGKILGVAPRLLAASLATFYVVQRFDLFLFGKLIQKLPKLSWKMRAACSLVVSQAFDTALFTLLGLYGVVENLLYVFWMSFGVKCSVIGLMALLWREKKGKSCEI